MSQIITINQKVDEIVQKFWEALVKNVQLFLFD